MGTFAFSACRFNMANVPANKPAMNAHLVNGASTTFNGCDFTTSNGDSETIRFFNAGYLLFNDCRFRAATPDTAPLIFVTGHQHRVAFNLCAMTDLLWTGGTRTEAVLSNLTPWNHAVNFAEFQILPGTLFQFLNDSQPAPPAQGVLRWVAGRIPWPCSE